MQSDFYCHFIFTPMLTHALLINVTGIQSYIFQSNKLAENIGASYIIENQIYNDLMKNVLSEQFGNRWKGDEWKTPPHTVYISQNGEVDCEIGYIGGGNALLLFRNKAFCDQFVKDFSTKSLLQFPGLELALGEHAAFDLEDYNTSFKALMKNLKKRKSANVFLSTVCKPGITDDCPWSNDAAEVYNRNEKIYISRSAMSKVAASEKINEKYAPPETFTLPKDLEHLGQEDEKSYIAVVHIDGNGMGKIFGNIQTLDELRSKSAKVSDKANGAMKALLKLLADKAQQNAGKEMKGDIDDLFFYNGTVMPIRPILVGGDDVTFVCEGRLGVWLAEQFIDLFYDKTQRALPSDDANKLMQGACAGIAIVKTHFPFYKAVTLAEELCQEAKRHARHAQGSYISYYISATTFSGSLSQLRARTHTTHDAKKLYFGPYRLFEPTDKHSIDALKAGIRFFSSDKWSASKNKLMRLREVLIANESTQKLFNKELKEWGMHLSPNKETAIWDNDSTPYFDQIELMDFYLPSLLKAETK